ncbi:MAG TPA: nucleoside-diphosphate kinase [Tepiditoga sp.]|nr:nucleoside-diphosphate kinase [Thermotogota bacterium]HOO75327.1 nucleoside-diphosphate kinase [Tepiditoga sp.]
MEKEFVMLKPNAVRRGLIGEIINRFEKRGLKITAMKFINPSSDQLEELYKEHAGKSFYNGLMEFASSGPVVVIILEGNRAIEMVRHIVGKTDPLEASPGSIRGEYGLSVRKNIVHASDSQENAEREMKIFFDHEEITEYELDAQDDI